MTNDDYAIEPWVGAYLTGYAGMIAGDMIDLITGATIVGPYCAWPKSERREFVVVPSPDAADAFAYLALDKSYPIIVGMDLGEGDMQHYLIDDVLENSTITITPEPFEDRITIYKNNAERYKTLKRVNSCNSWKFDEPVLKKIKRKKDWQHRYPWEK